MTIYYHLGQVADATRLVRDHHYSGKIPSVNVLCATAHLPGGLFGDMGEAVAACVFNHPAARWREEVVELVRLVRTDAFDEPLSKLVSFALSQCRILNICDLLVSYADPTHGHHGGIYQACSWNYGGQREARNDDYISVNGEVVHNRTLHGRYGTTSIIELRKRFPSWQVENASNQAEGKHLYWKPLSKHGKKKAGRLGLKAHPYPTSEASNE